MGEEETMSEVTEAAPNGDTTPEHKGEDVTKEEEKDWSKRNGSR